MFIGPKELVCSSGENIGEDFYHSNMFQVIFPNFTNDLRFYVQNLTLPTFSLGTTSGYSTMMNSQNTKLPGNSIDYGQLTITFMLDADLSGYTSLLAWMKGCAYPEEFSQFTRFIREDVGSSMNELSSSASNKIDANFLKLLHPIVVMLMSPTNQTICKYTFVNSFPVSLDGPTLDVKIQDNVPLTYSASFSYSWVDFENFLIKCKG